MPLTNTLNTQEKFSAPARSVVPAPSPVSGGWEMTTNDDKNSPMFGHESNGINRIRRKNRQKMMTK